MSDPTTQTAAYWISRLDLAPHPEGGHYRETYRSELILGPDCLPASFEGERRVSTAIYFLLAAREFSAFHRLRSDELWHFHAGSCVLVHIVSPAGQYRALEVGPDVDRGQAFQAVVPAGNWFASSLKHPGDDPDSFALVGCTVSPGFDFADFDLAARSDLLALFPQHAGLIERLTRE